MEKTLNLLKPGEKATIVKIKGTGPIRRRFLDMGIVRGVTLKVVKVAPLGDPIELKVKRFALALRKNEAKNIIVDKIVAKKSHGK